MTFSSLTALLKAELDYKKVLDSSSLFVLSAYLDSTALM